ncbi:hypothetical protein LCGC14_1327480 [marine sediment metagenome]|uniref:Uncharacterized protein n=1 Tax=marine sediment metagenome TaxID=412755 RepID=A0A0F9KI62_9ZZZZ
MAASRRRLILEEFRTRLQKIQTNNGFLTDAGDTIFLGEHVTLGPDDPDTALAIVVEEDFRKPSSQGMGSGALAAVEITLPVSVHALAKADLDEPLLAQEDVIDDIERAIELADRTLGGLVGELTQGSVTPLEREEGSTVVGAAVAYSVVYSKKWGDPAA